MLALSLEIPVFYIVLIFQNLMFALGKVKNSTEKEI